MAVKINPKNTKGRYATSSGCVRCEFCAKLMPTVFGLDENGRAFVKRQPMAPSEHEAIQVARKNCPLQGIYDHVECPLQDWEVDTSSPKDVKKTQK